MKYFIVFSKHKEYAAFCHSEFEALAALSGVIERPNSSLWVTSPIRPLTSPTAEVKLDEDEDEHAAFAVVDLPNEEVAREIFKRSVLTKAIVELWAEGETYQELRTCLEAQDADTKSRIAAHGSSAETFAFLVKSSGKKLTEDEQRNRMNFFAFLFHPDKKANISKPDTRFFIGEDWSQDSRRIGVPKFILFGRVVASRYSGSSFWLKYSLSERPVLGPTTTDNELAFLMANQAEVAPGMVVFDPFVGSGGLLIAAMHFGAFGIGADIDARVLKGWSIAYRNPGAHRIQNQKLKGMKKGSEEDAATDVFCNFRHYGLPSPEIVRADNATNVWRIPLADGLGPSHDDCANGEQEVANLPSGQSHPLPRFAKAIASGLPWVDAIITDPPYGIRASSRQSGRNGRASAVGGECYEHEEESTEERTNEQRQSYIASLVAYSSDVVWKDLMDLAAKVIVDGGKLVHLMPLAIDSSKEDIDASMSHPDFELVACSFQKLQTGRGRALVTLKRKPRRCEKNTA